MGGFFNFDPKPNATQIYLAFYMRRGQAFGLAEPLIGEKT